MRARLCVPNSPHPQASGKEEKDASRRLAFQHVVEEIHGHALDKNNEQDAALLSRLDMMSHSAMLHLYEIEASKLPTMMHYLAISWLISECDRMGVHVPHHYDGHYEDAEDRAPEYEDDYDIGAHFWPDVRVLPPTLPWIPTVLPRVQPRPLTCADNKVGELAVGFPLAFKLEFRTLILISNREQWPDFIARNIAHMLMPTFSMETLSWRDPKGVSQIIQPCFGRSVHSVYWPCSEAYTDYPDRLEELPQTGAFRWVIAADPDVINWVQVDRAILDPARRAARRAADTAANIAINARNGAPAAIAWVARATAAATAAATAVDAVEAAWRRLPPVPTFEPCEVEPLDGE